MTVVQIKRAVALLAASLAVASLVALLALGAMAVLATGSGADPADAFTDVAIADNDSVDVAWENTTVPNVELVDQRTQRQLAALWHDVMTARLGQLGEDHPYLADRLGPSLTTAFTAVDVPARVAGHDFAVSFVSPDAHVVEVVVATAIERMSNGEITARDEHFRATMVLEATGWTLLSLSRIGQ